MSLSLSFSIDELAQLYARGASNADAYGSPESAGLAAVLDHIAHAARKACAYDTERYDHRSLYEFTAELDYACRRAAAVPGDPESSSHGNPGPESH
jgi:hypothetical protein